MSEDAAGRVTAWLLTDGVGCADVGALLGGLGERLIEEGVPLARATSHIRTLHPRFFAAAHFWYPGRGVREFRRERPQSGPDPDHFGEYLHSPIQYVQENRRWLDRRLDDAAAAEFPTFTALRDEGMTHYISGPLHFSDGAVYCASWATDDEGGFRPEHKALFEAIVPAFQVVAELKTVRRVSTELLGAYVGVEPGEQILHGSIRRGHTRRVQAAILLADLRDFTGLSQSVEPEEVVALLNAYFDAVVPPIRDAGGEVLKFMGDGVLAMIRDDTREGVCDAVLAAAMQALRNLEGLSRPDGTPLQAGIALHWGEVAYGNIGSRDRLDFTAIGRDVNLVSRVAALCAATAAPLLVTRHFAARANAEFATIGTFALKGFPDPEPVLAPSQGRVGQA